MSNRNLLTTDQLAAIGRLLDDAMIDVKSTVDIDRLRDCRSLFRKKVPFGMRSWVAASLLMAATRGDSGRQRNQPRQGRQPAQSQQQPPERGTSGRQSQSQAQTAPSGRGANALPGRQQQQQQQPGNNKPTGKTGNQANQGRNKPALPQGNQSKEERGNRERNGNERNERNGRERSGEEAPLSLRENRYQGEGLSVFVSAGRRQRFYARVALKILLEHCQLAEEQIGDIRTMDNYSFISVDPAVADSIIAKLNGHPFKGRPLTVNLARKRDEADPAAPREERFAPQGDEDRGTGLRQTESDEPENEDIDRHVYSDGLDDDVDSDQDNRPLMERADRRFADAGPVDGDDLTDDFDDDDDLDASGHDGIDGDDTDNSPLSRDKYDDDSDADIGND
ncbi:MAG: hypothetical protein A2087_08985 [Spirochaetes bacterium GWD1_61_31]|nr:MAG: hypothetical protein A2Y37_13390 [Spirochaetes bacterium GWB1_60_80]OHD30042.1 MAG: hypothetical protein A2004_03465 [Spirochaetes bacterium GWC1_61_12]OHD42566.1 MAG: hypothetical protein A2087_08985 [Spirochaetes bacterium GWD1_61_31]OHD45048.1 MAG: hypothetical protein A2Y35_12610 [Spirochaetes bacterium GWE1_60_18]OHD59977.1 MAG: hypothetical protein A2Y32_14465 [Spirochaetes bacterium GWF1_60_12]HAP42944.1 hypothetical protein [Spirochaetaceae bacterium]